MTFLGNKIRGYLADDEKIALPKFFREIKQLAEFEFADVEEICRTACQANYLGNNVVLCRVLTKYLMFADAQDIGITPHLCLNGFWETWVTKRFVQVIQPGWNCVDIGANHGYFALIMADIAGQTGRILAVEPNPKLLKFLSQNLEVNGFLSFSEIAQKAVSESDGSVASLVIPQGRALNATITMQKSNADEHFEVETATLDSLTKDWHHVDFVKIDAEGAEQKIWDGMQETIEKNPQMIVVMEFKNSRYDNPREFLQRILSDGFVLRHLDYDADVKSLTLEKALTERFDEDWMLFLCRDDSMTF